MIFEASGSVPTQEGTAQTLPQRRLNGECNSVGIFMFLWCVFLAIRIHHREEKKEMIEIIARILIIIGFVALVVFCAYGAGWRAKEEKNNASMDRKKGDQNSEL